MSQLEKRVKNIKDKVSMIQILKDYGLYPFTYEVENFQMRCPFHGADNKPSSHVYDGKTWTCFTCHRKNYDVIAFVQEREGLEKFGSVLRHIEHKYNLPKIAYDPNDDYDPEESTKESKNEQSIFDLHKMLEKQVIGMKKSMSLERYSKLFFLLDHAEKENKMDVMKKVQDKIKEFKRLGC